MNNRVEKGFRAAAAAGIILFSGCLESPRPVPPAETPPIKTPMADSLKEKFPTPQDLPLWGKYLFAIWVGVGLTAAAIAGYHWAGRRSIL